MERERMANKKKSKSRARGGQGRLLALRLGVWFLLLALTGGVIYGAHATVANLFYRNNPRTTLRHIEVILNNDRLDPDQIRRRLNLRIGKDNLLDVDLAVMRNRLLEDPLIEQTEVRRQLPGTLVIRVYLRVPVARLVNSQGFLVDKHGNVLPPLVLDGAERLPTIVGVRALTEYRPGDKVSDDFMVKAALEFLRIRATHPRGNWLDVESIQLNSWHKTLAIYLRANPAQRILSGAKITLATEDIQGSVERALAVIEHRSAAGQATQEIESLSEKVPVRP